MKYIANKSRLSNMIKHESHNKPVELKNISNCTKNAIWMLEIFGDEVIAEPNYLKDKYGVLTFQDSINIRIEITNRIHYKIFIDNKLESEFNGWDQKFRISL